MSFCENKANPQKRICMFFCICQLHVLSPCYLHLLQKCAQFRREASADWVCPNTCIVLDGSLFPLCSVFSWGTKQTTELTGYKFLCSKLRERSYMNKTSLSSSYSTRGSNFVVLWSPEVGTDFFILFFSFLFFCLIH